MNQDTHHSEITKEDNNKGEPVFLERIPIMLRSRYCRPEPSLHNDVALNQMRECHVDQGGYFIINGSEKVMIGVRADVR